MGSTNVYGLQGSEMISHKKIPIILLNFCVINMTVISLINVVSISDVCSEFTHSSNDHYRALM